MPRSLQDEVHTDFSTGSAVWSGYHDQITGGYLTTGASGGYVDWDNHLMREYNRKIDTFSGAWGVAQAEDLILKPHDAGFRYTGTGYFKWDQYSVQFDGVDAYVDLGKPSAGTAAKTLSMWINPDTTVNNDRIISNTDNTDWGLRFNAGNIESWGGGAWAVLTSSPSAGAWTHLVIVFNGSAKQQAYKNGVAGSNVAAPYDLSNLGLGAKLSLSHGQYFDGKIDEVAIWDSALTSDQISAIYNGGTPQSLAAYNPDSWWRMGDGDTYPTLQDSSANNFTGTMINMASADIVADTP